MKKSDIRRIIKEELINELRGSYINEAFGDPLVAKLAKLGARDLNRSYKNFWTAAAKTYDIAWDKLPKGSVRKVQPTSPDVKTGMAFYVINQDIQNPFASSRGWAYDRVLRGPAVLAVTIDNKIQYYGRQGGIGGKQATSSYRGAPEPIGKGAYGTMMVKKLKELADEVYVFDLESYRGGTTALKAKRADLKLGKDTFKDAKAWKAANLARYKSILQSRVGSRDTVDGMVAKIVKIANEAVTNSMEVPKMNKYDELVTTIGGNEVVVEYVTRAMTRALRYYAEYIRHENSETREKEDGYGAKYYGEMKLDSAGSIKTILTAFQSGNARAIERA